MRAILWSPDGSNYEGETEINQPLTVILWPERRPMEVRIDAPEQPPPAFREYVFVIELGGARHYLRRSQR